MRITFAEGAGDKSVKVIRPNQLASKNELEMVLADNSESVKYYVYGVVYTSVLIAVSLRSSLFVINSCEVTL